MKIAATPSNNYDIKYRKNNTQPPVVQSEVKAPQGSVAFGNALKNGATGVFKFIEKSGFFVEFLIVDTLSMVLPRIWIGLNRDKDKLGHYNYKAGAEEAGREILSGPSMNLIPMGIMAAVGASQAATKLSKEALKGFDGVMKSVLEKSSNISKKEVLEKEFADKLFDEAFKDFDLADKDALKGKFSELLIDSTKAEKKLFAKNEIFKNKLKEFEEHVALINNKNIKTKPLNTKAVNIGGGTNAKELFEDFRNYSKDIIEKLTKQTSAKDALESLGKMTKGRLNVKFATAIAAFFAVGGFLTYLPKVYQQGKISPAQESAMRAEGGAHENS